ncbi:MAG TPA: LemA family protein [Candidatus Goldiibacteriota bacterium]|nr:LemA family protein [Candidatus Goldiibacteriota bacterium]HPI02460.1 LemA family protein [Candidatus Goldiibacteriota bacterium]HRQ43095.1 LemA family protein [Candidatus Goldiibacteriota bacterium]
MALTAIVLGIVFVIAVFVIGIFNKLVSLKNRNSEAWAQIDVQLKQRADLIPNLVETVKGYAAHEKETLEKVIQARAALTGAGADVAKTAAADNMLTGALKSLFAVSENYPQLKADAHFTQLMTDLSGTESKIAYARQFFNETVRVYNEYQQAFPGVIFAGMFGHTQKQFFEAPEEDKKPVSVKF